MAVFDTIKIYSFLVEQSSKIIPKATLQSSANDVQTLDVISINGGAELEQEIIEYINKYKQTINNKVLTFNITTKYKDFPTTAETVESFLYAKILDYNFHFISFDTYKILPNGMALTDGIAVNLRSYSIEHNNISGANKRLNIEFEVRNI